MDSDKLGETLLKMLKPFSQDVERTYSLVGRLQDLVEEIEETAREEGYDAGLRDGREAAEDEWVDATDASYNNGFEDGFQEGLECAEDE